MTLITSGLNLTLSMQMTYTKMQEWEQVTLLLTNRFLRCYTERRKADSFLSDTLMLLLGLLLMKLQMHKLQDSLSDNYARFDAMFNHLSDSIQATLDSAALACYR